MQLKSLQCEVFLWVKGILLLFREYWRTSIQFHHNFSNVGLFLSFKNQSREKKLSNSNSLFVKVSEHQHICCAVCLCLSHTLTTFNWTIILKLLLLANEKISLGTSVIGQMFNYTALWLSFKLEISNGTTRQFHSYCILDTRWHTKCIFHISKQSLCKQCFSRKLYLLNSS